MYLKLVNCTFKHSYNGKFWLVYVLAHFKKSDTEDKIQYSKTLG